MLFSPLVNTTSSILILKVISVVYFVTNPNMNNKLCSLSVGDDTSQQLTPVQRKIRMFPAQQVLVLPGHVMRVVGCRAVYNMCSHIYGHFRKMFNIRIFDDDGVLLGCVQVLIVRSQCIFCGCCDTLIFGQQLPLNPPTSACNTAKVFTVNQIIKTLQQLGYQISFHSKLTKQCLPQIPCGGRVCQCVGGKLVI